MLRIVTPWVLAFCCIAGWPPPSVGATTCSTPSAISASEVAIIGDSYTAGSAMGGVRDKSWSSVAQNLLNGLGVPVSFTVGADRGSGYAKAGSRGTVFADQIPKAVSAKDSLVVLFGSLNDGSISVDQLEPAVHRTLELAKSAAPNASLLVIGPSWVNASPPPQVFRIRDILEGQSRAIGADFVDPLSERWFADNPELIGADGIHPTDVGHAYLADKIGPRIAQQLDCEQLR